MAGLAQRKELAAFLRSRREALDPTEVGIEPGPRRRTPGLRREEVAQISGVSVTWYSWLEQHRDITVSRQVADAIARTLRLTAPERRHLFALTGHPLPPEPQGRGDVGSSLRRLVGVLEPQPAYVINRCWDILAWNRGYERLVGGLSHLAPEECNSLWLLFTRDTLRTVICDWEEDARRLVGQFRAVAGERADDPRVRSLVRALTTSSDEFRQLWSEHPIDEFTPARKQFRHPVAGLLTVDYLKLAAIDRPDHHLVTYLPADEATADRMARLVAATGGVDVRSRAEPQPAADNATGSWST